MATKKTAGKKVAKKSANRPKTDKRKAPRTAWKPGQSGNPKGRPAEGESWAAVIKRISNMDSEDAVNIAAEILAKVTPIKGVTLKEMVVLRSFAALMFEPQASMLNALMDRAEGKLAQTIRTWQDEVIELLRTKQVDPAIVSDELGDELARELFIAAGVPLAESREDQTAGGNRTPTEGK